MTMVEFLKFQKSNCKNCYKCIRHCPVKSIRFSGNQANVIANECILCGQCYVVCPQNAKKIADETEIVGVLLKSGAPVIASIAPSFAAYFRGTGITALETALKRLGFFAAEETALGAEEVKKEYERLCDEGIYDNLITSCCHTVNLLIEKYYPQLTGNLAPVKTPMRAHCDSIRMRYPGAKTVFIGPCLSKKDEAARDGIDAALTFDELSSMLAAAGIAIGDEADTAPGGISRLFPTNGGVLNSMFHKNPNYTYLAVDGMENCKRVFDDLANGQIHHCFIEVSACAGSCSGGPIMEKHKNTPLRNYQAVRSYAGSQDFVGERLAVDMHADYEAVAREERFPTEAEIRDILRKMGKFRPGDELNCGTCGYNTCREKAIAVYQGKAEMNMCLPYLMEKSERFTNNILDNTPNGILVVNDRYEIQEINRAALTMLRIHSRSDVLGEPLVRVMDPLDFLSALEDGKKIIDKRDYYAEIDKYLSLTIVHDKVSNHLIAIFRDITEEENARKSKEAFSRQTVETADKVVERQMCIVQEIASLLGETAAETKIALTKLKESITDGNSQ